MVFPPLGMAFLHIQIRQTKVMGGLRAHPVFLDIILCLVYWGGISASIRLVNQLIVTIVEALAFEIDVLSIAISLLWRLLTLTSLGLNCRSLFRSYNLSFFRSDLKDGLGSLRDFILLHINLLCRLLHHFQWLKV